MLAIAGSLVGVYLRYRRMDLLRALFGQLEVDDVALFLQDSRDFHLQLGRRDVHLLVPRLEALRTRVSMSAMGSDDVMLLVPSLPSYPTCYQLDFVTPGISPASASLRKQMRHSVNLRMIAARPSARLQRLR